MKELASKYQEKLDAIATGIQESEELSSYLEEEEEEFYQGLRERFEPKIKDLYGEVADADPLQLYAFENTLIEEKFEGLFLPRILGYAVLRGVINDNYKYLRPQDHFKKILLAICESSNFELIRKRIGQTIQMGFALSSDIWITNLINQFSNKKIKYFLQGQKLPRYRDMRDRAIGHARYKAQFRKENFMTTEFPTDFSQLKVMFPSVRSFLHYRILHQLPNISFIPDIRQFIDNPNFASTPELIEVLALYGLFFDLGEEDHAHLKKAFNEARKNIDGFEDQWLALLIKLRQSTLNIEGKADSRLSALLDRSNKDNIVRLYDLLDEVHSKGYMHEDAIEAVKVFYGQHEGLSDINECVRQAIKNYIAQFMKNITDTEYSEYFELSKIFPVYIDIFFNQQFNQDIKVLCLSYVKKLLKRYTDKRGKDYQDIKKFVTTNFVDLGFMKEKEVAELFKTRRKRKKVE